MPAKKKTSKKATTKRKVASRKPAAKKKVAKKKVAKKKPAARKAVKKVAKKVVKTVAKAAPKAMKTTAIKDAYKKTQITSYVSEHTGLSKKEVTGVMEALENLMHRHVRKGGAGEFTLPGLLKCRIVRKPATKARKGVNPFTGEACTFKAKPARNVVKVRPLKKLKEMAE
jgi:nucleoid DNA-binding protein